MDRFKKSKSSHNFKRSKVLDDKYSPFNKINGKHPLQERVPSSTVLYKARLRENGKVLAFNFNLAKEMGLISKNHPEKLNKKLEKKILETFGLVIINEYDIENEVQFDEDKVLPFSYMATRYVQLQHENKQGKTSGDGRSVWNGQVSYRGKTFDISSCGTGATCLSPATAKFKKNFQSGDPSISYGCGYSEKDEGIGTLLMSEILYHNKIPTERVLAVIEFEKGLSINVRVHENLLRPSHLFLYLKQNRHQELTEIVDFYIERQIQNKVWTNVPESKNKKYDFFLEKFTKKFAEVSALFEDEYIFCWLDWDGDNILMDGSIIDYGSVRQFGLFHNEYRYDDSDRYSTSLSEQKIKAKYMSQTMAQLVDFLKTGVRKPRKSFSSHPMMKTFDQHFQYSRSKFLFRKIGFHPSFFDEFMKINKKTFIKFEKSFRYFERCKSKLGPVSVSDGINWNAIFCMRDILREYPSKRLMDDNPLAVSEFVESMGSSYSTWEDLELNPYRTKMANLFQKSYRELISQYAQLRNKTDRSALLEVNMRSSLINQHDRITGDSITQLVYKILNSRPKMGPKEIQTFLNEIVQYQNLDPDSSMNKSRKTKKKTDSKMMKSAIKLVKDYSEGL